MELVNGLHPMVFWKVIKSKSMCYTLLCLDAVKMGGSDECSCTLNVDIVLYCAPLLIW